MYRTCSSWSFSTSPFSMWRILPSRSSALSLFCIFFSAERDVPPAAAVWTMRTITTMRTRKKPSPSVAGLKRKRSLCAAEETPLTRMTTRKRISLYGPCAAGLKRKKPLSRSSRPASPASPSTSRITSSSKPPARHASSRLPLCLCRRPLPLILQTPSPNGRGPTTA